MPLRTATGGPSRCPRARGWLLPLLLCVGLAAPVLAQVEPDDEPLLPDTISDIDVEMRGRYVRQWREDDGTWVLMFTGGFRLEMGRRQLSANDAVVWVLPKQSEAEGRKYYELTVYLSQSAEVREPAGTTIEDSMLLVSNLRTYGRVAKEYDAQSPEVMRDSPLYQEALRARTRAEEGAIAPKEPAPIEVTRPKAAGSGEERPPRTLRWQLSSVDSAETPTGEIVQVATGGVYFSESGSPESPVLEIQADNAVVFPAEGAADAILGTDVEGEVRDAPSEPPSEEQREQPAAPTKARGQEQAPGESMLEAQPGIAKRVRAVYLEGDVRLSLGDRFVRANRLYYDFERSQALILDSV
jgi:hypothetical protein